MFRRFVSRAGLAAALLALAACSQAPRDPGPVAGGPFPAPGPVTQPQYAPPPGADTPVPGAQDVVLRGAAYAASGDGRFPPNSRMTVRIYDAAVGDVNDWAAEQSYTRSGALPWPYEMRFRTEAIAGLARPALAARIEGPDGRLVYRSEVAVPLVEGGSDDIPMSAVGAGGVVQSSAGAQQYVGAPIQRGPRPQYGIPDPNVGYGVQNYTTPTYPGQSFEPTTISGPPTNGTF